jgi:TolA-binding protein
MEESARAQQESETATMQFMQALEAGKSDEAIRLLALVNVDLLSELELSMVKPVLSKFRSEASESTYRAGTTLRSSGRKSDAVVAFRQSLAVSPKGRFSNQARYLLGITLRESWLYKGAIEVFQAIRTVEKDRAVLDEVLYWQGYSHLQLGDVSEGKTILEQVVSSGSRHASAAKTQLASLGPSEVTGTATP